MKSWLMFLDSSDCPHKGDSGVCTCRRAVFGEYHCEFRICPIKAAVVFRDWEDRVGWDDNIVERVAAHLDDAEPDSLCVVAWNIGITNRACPVRDGKTCNFYDEPGGCCKSGCPLEAGRVLRVEQ